MRRKNLIFTSGLIFLLVLLHGMGLPLKTSVLSDFYETGQRQETELEGLVTKIEPSGDGRYKLEIKIQYASHRKLKGREKILVTYENEMQEPWQLYLRQVTLAGILKEPQCRRNPGCFDYRLYLKSRNIFFETDTSCLHLLEEPPNFIKKGLRWILKQRFQFAASLSEDSAGLVCGMLFGDTSLLEESVYEEFRMNGTAHILAVSGLHVGILYALYKKIFGNRQTIWSALSLTFLLFCYGSLSMWSSSMCRAAVMIGLHETARMLDLRYDMTTGLCTAALGFLLQNPYCIFGTGFQMSFLAIASICFLTKILPASLPDGMTAGLAVNLGLLLYQMYQFNYVSFVSVFVNIPIIYLTGLLVPLSLGSFLFYAAAGYLPPVLHLLLDSLSFFTVKVNSLSALGGYGSIDVVSPPLWLVACGYFLLFFLSSEQNLVLHARSSWKKLVGILTAGMLCGLLGSSLFYCPVSDADVVFVDVGQGDCIHIRDGRHHVLIDGGGSINYNIGKDTLKPYLLKNGVWTVDAALATHLHMDHYKGLAELSEVYPVRNLYTGMTAGDAVYVSDRVWIETLWPLEIDPETGQDENEACSVFMVHYGDWNILITGDLDETGENAMLDYYAASGSTERLKADVLKVGHHGSRTSTGDRFLDAVAPEAAVIQVGKNNTYGHPSQIIIEKCRKKDIILVRNDYSGGIGFTFQKGRFHINTVL